MSLVEYLNAERKEVERTFGVCNNKTMERFAKEGYCKKFQKEHGREYRVPSLVKKINHN